jgi:hypothetical protein
VESDVARSKCESGFTPQWIEAKRKSRRKAAPTASAPQTNPLSRPSCIAVATIADYIGLRLIFSREIFFRILFARAPSFPAAREKKLPPSPRVLLSSADFL